jgi:hypothetical protein
MIRRVAVKRLGLVRSLLRILTSLHSQSYRWPKIPSFERLKVRSIVHVGTRG